MISPRTLLLFYSRHLRVQPLRELMAVLGVAAGVALLFTVQLANSSVTESFNQVAHGVAGRASLEVAARAPEGFPESVAEEVEHTSGVKAAAPLLQQRIVAAGPKGSLALTLVGADERLPALGGRLVRRFQGAIESSRKGLVVMTAPVAAALGVRAGQEVQIRIAGRAEHLRLAAAVAADRLGSLANSPVAATSLPILQSMSQLPQRVSRVLVQADPGQERSVRDALASRFGSTLNVRPIDAEDRFLAIAASPESQATTLFSVISLVVGLILAYNALLLASGERRSFIRYLTDLGTPDGIVVASLAFDALLLGLVGCVIGLALGDVISLYAYHSLPAYLTETFPIGAGRVITLHAVAIAFAGGMLAALAAASLPAIAIMRSSDPTGDSGRLLSFAGKPRLADAAVLAAGLSLVVVSVLAALLHPAITIPALALFAIGLVLCMPMAVRYMLRAARALSRRVSDPAMRLSAAELQSSPTRSVALFATGMIAVFATVMIGGTVADVHRGVRLGARETGAGADLWITASPRQDIYTAQPFPGASVQARLTHVAQVASVLPYRESFLDLPQRRIWVIGVPPRASTPIPPSQFLHGSLANASMRLREGGWALITQTLANERHLHIGQSFQLPTPSGNASLRLAGTISNYGWIPGTVLMNGTDYARLWHSPRMSQLAVTFKPGVPLAEGRRAVQGALPSGSALTILSDAERETQWSDVLGGTLSRLEEASSVVLLVAIAAVVAMMVAAVWQRRGRLEALISMGMSSGQLARMVFYESGWVLLGGCLLGMAAGIAGQGLGDNWLNHTVGVPAHFVPAWQLGLRTILITALVSIAATVLAVLRTVGFEPRAAFSTE